MIIFKVNEILTKGDEEMKKYIILFLSTLLIISVITMSGYMLRGEEVSCKVMTVKAQDMDNVITASGKLQYRAGKPVKAAFAGIIESVSVKNGDHVKKDDPLFSYYKIDDAYTALLSEYTGLGSVDAILGAASKYGNPGEMINELKKYCETESVNAPCEGKVSGLSLREDDIFTKNTVVLKLSEEQSLEIPVNISEVYIGSIEKGQVADIVFNADRKKHYSGRVAEISDEAAQTSGLAGKETTVEVKLVLDDNDKDLRAGYSAECTIVTCTDKGVVVLPYELIRTDENGDYVFTERGGRAKKTPVTTGREYKDGIEIKTGIRENDIVITESAELSDGQRISIAERTVQKDA